MSPQHLNYCRQLVKQSSEALQVPSLDPTKRAVFHKVIDLVGASTKFLLPPGGRMFDDLEYKALDENEPLRLPYKYTAIEYSSNGIERGESDPVYFLEGQPVYEAADSVSAPKRIILARERDNWIVLTIAFWTRHDGTWRVLPECALPCTGYLDRSHKSIKGRVGIKAAFESNTPHSDYADELGAMLCFLNALQCSNVKIEKSAPKNNGKKIKTSLAFDSYHLLTVELTKSNQGTGSGGGHRSPREHLRRGHIRRLEDKKIWVNASVVSAGSAGRISKDYFVGA